MSRTISCPDDHLLQQFLLAEFDDDKTADLEEHLLYCNRCWESARRLRATNDLVESLRVRPTVAADPEGEVVAELIDRLGLAASPVPEQITPAPPLSALNDPVAWVCSQLSEPQGPDELARMGSYVLHQHLGSGGMGMVFQAQDRQLRRPVALKLMKPTLAVNDTCRQRFLREARAAAAIDHDNIVTVYQVGEERGIPFLAMQMLQGESLDHRLLRPERLPLSEIVRIGREIAQGLAAAHERGLVHRDIKPANIWLEAGGRVKLLDFGLAWADEDDRLTKSGTMVGTPGYMAPELARGEAFDARSDLFSLGCVLFQLCQGELPFQGRDTMALLLALALDQPKPLRETNPEVPPSLSDLVTHLLAKNPAERPESAQKVIEALAGIERDLSSRPDEPASPGKTGAMRGSTRIIWVAAAALLLCALGLYAFQALRKDPRASMADPAPVAAAGQEQPAPRKEKPKPPVNPLAILPFEERGAATKEYGTKISDILFSKLTAYPDIYLVDRQDLKKVLQEQELNLSGMVKEKEAIQVGQLTGARILVTGSVLQIDRKIYLVAKLISTETGRMVGASIDGKASDEIAPLVEKLAEMIAEKIKTDASHLVPSPPSQIDRIAALNQKLKKAHRPVLWVQVAERHVGQATFDPAAQTELILFSRGAGFEVEDAEEGRKNRADLVVTGEGLSEFAGRHGNLLTVKARVEVKVVDPRSGQVIAVERQTSVAVDLSEQLAGKAALQKAAADIAERLLPKLVR